MSAVLLVEREGRTCWFVRCDFRIGEFHDLIAQISGAQPHRGFNARARVTVATREFIVQSGGY